MEEYSVKSSMEGLSVINLGLATPESYLSAVGITGATAYFALLDIARPKQDETVLISSAASSVGSLAAQIARSRGCRVVGIVSTEEKAAKTQQAFGYDQVISYRDKSIDQLAKDISAACPDGVDIYFDNTSGDISEAVLDCYNDFARIVVVGRIAINHLADTSQDIGRRDNNQILAQRIRKQGFVLLDYLDRIKGAFLVLAKWVAEEQIVSKVDCLSGIENAHRAFFECSMAVRMANNWLSWPKSTTASTPPHGGWANY